MKRVIRFSLLNDAERCPASIVTEEEARRALGLPRSTSEASRFGTAVHELLARISSREDVEPVVEELARKHHVNPAQLRDFVEALDYDPTRAEPREVKVEKRIETELSNCILRGHPDLIRVFDAHVECIDWKTGWGAAQGLEPSAAFHRQVHAGAVLAAREAGVDRARATVVLCRSRRWDTFDMMDLDEIWSEVQEIAIRAAAQGNRPVHEREMHVGDWCRWKACRAICPAYRERMEASLALVSAPVQVDESELPKTKAGKVNKRALQKAQKQALQRRVEERVAQDPAKAYDVYLLASTLADGLKTALKEHVDFFGPVTLGDGRVYDAREEEVRSPISEKFVLDAIDEVDATTSPDEPAPAALERLRKKILDRPPIVRKAYRARREIDGGEAPEAG